MSSRSEPHFSWIRVGSHKWEQDYGFQDAFYGTILGEAGKQALFLVAMSIKIDFKSPNPTDTAEALRTAWIQMRWAYPIFSTVSYRTKRSYQSPRDQSEIEAWANDTFKVHPGKTTSDLWTALVKTHQPTMHYFPDTSEILLQAEHTHCDGRGGTHFWHEFLTLLVNPKPIKLGEDAANLPGISDTYINMQERSPGRGLQLAKNMVESLTINAPDTPICYPISDQSNMAQRQLSLINSRATWSFSMEDTRAITNACKAHNLSLVAVWHAAVVFTTQDIQKSVGAKPGSTFITNGNFDLRRYFNNNEQEIAKGQAPIGNFHCVLPYVAKPNGRSFLDVARDLSCFYKLGLQEQPDLLSALRPMMRIMGNAFTEGPFVDTTPGISSLGVVDHFVKEKYTGPARECVTGDAWFGDTVTGPWMECFSWIWKGRLVLGSCFNGEFYSGEEVDDFHRQVAARVKTGLGLEGLSKL